MNKQVIDMPKNFVKPECINVYVSLPCPLKVPFKQLFDPFMESWNSDSNNLPINIPSKDTCSPGDFEELMMTSDSEDLLPDVYITSSYKILFSELFSEKYLMSNIYTGLPKEMYGDDYPENVIEVAEKYNIGFLGFSSWGLIHDTKYTGEHSIPARWEELTEPGYKNLISIHGCHGQAGNISMLMNLKSAGGSTAIELLAHNIKKAEHFSKLIKELGSNKDSATPFYIMPNVAIANIPSTKKAELINVKEQVISPLMIIVKQSRLKESRGLLEFFTGSVFKRLLASHSFFQPQDIEGIEEHKFDHMDMFVKESYQRIYEELNKLFITSLGDKIPMNGHG